MSRLIFMTLVVLATFSCKPTFKVVEQPADYSLVVKGGKVDGVIFLEDGECFMCLEGMERFSPSLSEIQQAETILKQELVALNSSLMNQGNGCPVIHQNLKHYRRQYFGFVDDAGNKIIYATFGWNRYTMGNWLRGEHRGESDRWKFEREIVLNGCSHYWEVKIDLTRKMLFGFSVNGLS